MERGGHSAELKRLLEQLRDPARLRMVTAGLTLLIGYAGIYMPLSRRIDQTSRNLQRECKRQEMANDVEFLRAQVEKFQDRLPENTDTNEWVQYVLNGIRKFPLKLVTLDSDSPRRCGPYDAVVLHVDLEGDFHDLDALLHWLEANQRLFRVESVAIAPASDRTDKLAMRLTLLGVKG